MTRAALEDIADSAVERVFEKNYHIARENEPAAYIYIIRKGCVTETGTSNYKAKKGIGSITPKLELVNGKPNYVTSFLNP